MFAENRPEPRSLKNLNRILELAGAQEAGSESYSYFPEQWNCFGYTGYQKDPGRPGEILVNPCSFLKACVRAILDRSARGPMERVPVTENVIYGILPRTATAWRHGAGEKIAGGTLLKTILLLPMLQRFSVSILYLLPIFQTGRVHRKGDLGSPYAIRDIYEIDENLHDPLLGAYTPELLHTEFRALVEACHALGIRVMVDFAFRTVSRDNVLIGRHPDWFYWIKKECNDHFAPPTIENREKTYGINSVTIGRLYRSPDFKKYVSRFTLPPDAIDREKWENVKAGPAETLAERIETEFGITVMPGFPDVINDRQPAWSDVTYLKYYFDSAPQTHRYIPKNAPPFLMQDSASLSKFHGEKKNRPLWDYVTEALPHYIREFGIDGARIDMAHAMPPELNAEMISKIRSLAPEFLLWSEELSPSGGAQARADGFDFISGDTYFVYKKAGKAGFRRDLLEKCLLRSELPLVASLETPDTPRSAQVIPSRNLLKMLLVLNAFAPNAIPYINCGQELLERQPMNLGLDNDANGRFVLEKDDPMYGKIAFFDTCCFHWNSPGDGVAETLEAILRLRKEQAGLLRPRCFVTTVEGVHGRLTVPLLYENPQTGWGLFIAGNASATARAALALEECLSADAGHVQATLLYGSSGAHNRPLDLKNRFYLAPHEAVVIQFHKI